MGILGPPNIERMKEKKNVKGLIKALGYEKEEKVRKAAADALFKLGWKPDRGETGAAFEKALKKGHSETVKWLLENGAVIDAEKSLRDGQEFYKKKGCIDPEAYHDFRIAIMILLGLDPWWHEDTQERLVLIQDAQEAISPKGKGFTELLVKVLEGDPSSENRALAAIALGILHADFQLLQASGFMERPLFQYERSIDDHLVEKPLSLFDFRSLRADSRQGESVDPRVIEALREALADDGTTTLDPSHNSYPRLDMHLHLYMSTAQERTLANELRKGESKEPFLLTSDYKGVAFAAAFSLVLIGDKESARSIVELGFESVVGSYKRVYFFKLAYDLGFSAVAVELARIYVQNKDISGFAKEFKKGYSEGRWALDCLSVMDDLEKFIPSLKGEDKNVLEAVTKELKKPG